ncbi:MAG: transporter substrate-binding domain-containing protein [Brucellaceae bacterium]|nr:transporter substrate-binding domain-containing protein [Brucellaceae bacterium]
MERLMRRLLGVAAILVSTVAVSHAQDGGVWGKIESSGQLNCGVLTDHIPASWKVAGSENYLGYIPNFCRAIAPILAEDMGKEIKVNYVPTSWATVILDTQSGRIDLAGGLSITEERQKAIDMPGPAYVLSDTILVRKDFPVYKTWEEYNKPEVRSANTTGTSTERTSLRLLPNAQQLSFKDRPSLILAMQSGRADITVSAFVAALGVMKEAPDLFGGWVVPTPRNEQPSAFGVRKDGDGRFAAWVQAWADEARADGTVQELMRDALAEGGLDVSDLSGLGE